MGDARPARRLAGCLGATARRPHRWPGRGLPGGLPAGQPAPAGSPIPLASDGHAPDWNISLAGDNVVAEAWSHQRPVLALRGLNGTPGMVAMALPLIVGARTTGMVALARRTAWDGAALDKLAHLVEDAALR